METVLLQSEKGNEVYNETKKKKSHKEERYEVQRGIGGEGLKKSCSISKGWGGGGRRLERCGTLACDARYCPSC